MSGAGNQGMQPEEVPAGASLYKKPEGEKPDDYDRWSALVALTVGVGVSAVLTAGAMVAANHFTGIRQPEVALSIVFVSAVVVLIVVVGTLTIVFRRLNLQNPQEAMGLPSGSVRAIIALLLIMLFFIAAIFLFNNTRNEVTSTEPRTLTGVTPERLALIPTDDIITSTTRTVNGASVTDLTLFPPSSATTTSNNIALQLITTTATLVTAIAAFYFGANSVEVAKRKTKAEEKRKADEQKAKEDKAAKAKAAEEAKVAKAKEEAEKAAKAREEAERLAKDRPDAPPQDPGADGAADEPPPLPPAQPGGATPVVPKPNG